MPGNNEPWPEVRDTLNSSAGLVELLLPRDAAAGIPSVDHYVYERVRDFLVRRHKVAGRGNRGSRSMCVYGELGVLRLERLP